MFIFLTMRDSFSTDKKLVKIFEHLVISVSPYPGRLFRKWLKVQHELIENKLGANFKFAIFTLNPGKIHCNS